MSPNETLERIRLIVREQVRAALEHRVGATPADPGASDAFPEGERSGSL